MLHRQQPGRPGADAEVEAIIERQGWRVRDDHPARASLAQAITTLRAIGRPELLDAIDDYARAADRLARREVDHVLAIEDEEAQAEAVIAGVVLGDALLSALRRLAEESALAGRIGPPHPGRRGQVRSRARTEPPCRPPCIMNGGTYRLPRVG